MKILLTNNPNPEPPPLVFSVELTRKDLELLREDKENISEKFKNAASMDVPTAWTLLKILLEKGN